jgi:hypothetical protein
MIASKQAASRELRTLTASEIDVVSGGAGQDLQDLTCISWNSI